MQHNTVVTQLDGTNEIANSLKVFFLLLQAVQC